MFVVSRPLAIYAVKKLATVDYTVANRVTEDVAEVVQWAYNHDLPWIPPIAMDLLHTFDDLGSMLIMLVMWLVHHTN
jgi:hypothetical protein|tara:strand:+ start:17404 stop:17634 length:231 start_codon:yes stop_codon:yes gene_type:complete